MKVFPAFVMSVCAVLAGCLPTGQLPDVGASSRYDIATYREDTTLSSDLTGLWIAIHEGTLSETVDGVEYRMTGNIREIVEVTRTAGVYYVRSCLLPDIRHAVSVSGNSVTASYNNLSAQLTLSSNTAMAGTTSRSAASSEYAGTLAMKKVAPLGETFGLFSFMQANKTETVATASCFQEASLHVVGSQLMFSKWADVELANISDWTGSTFRQTGYMYSRGGTADPVRQLRFGDGNEADGMTLREYPQNKEVLAVSIATSTATDYLADFTLQGVIDGAVTLDMDIAEASTTPAPAPTTAGSSSSAPASTPSTSEGSYDYLSMMQWMSGFYQINMPW